MHGGVRVADVNTPGVRAMLRGLSNMEKHLENITKFEQPCVVAINHFPSDTAAEVETLRRHCEALGLPAVVSRGFAEGGKGCMALAEVVRDKVAENEPHFRPLYDWNA